MLVGFGASPSPGHVDWELVTSSQKPADLPKLQGAAGCSQHPHDEEHPRDLGGA